MMPPAGAESRSVFHINSNSDLNQEMQDCYQGIEEFRSAMKNLDGAGTHLTESLAQMLRGTNYQRVGEQLSGSFREVYGSQGSIRFLEQLKEMEAMLLGAEFPREGSQEELRMVCAQVSGLCTCLLEMNVYTVQLNEPLKKEKKERKTTTKKKTLERASFLAEHSLSLFVLLLFLSVSVFLSSLLVFFFFCLLTSFSIMFMF